MGNERSSRPWLRTLSDDDAAVAIELITCTREALLERMREVDFVQVHSFHVPLELHGRSAATVQLRWELGYLEVALEGVSATEPFIDRHGRCFTSLEVGDTPSIADTGITIDSVRSIADRLDYWLEGLGSPHHQTLPECYYERISRFLDRLAIAVDTSEPDWDHLHVEPCRQGLSCVIMVAFESCVMDVGIGNDMPEYELHPELAHDIIDLMSYYTEVRLNDFRNENDLRVHIGDMGIMSLGKLDTVRMLRLHARCSDRLTLYAHPRR